MTTFLKKSNAASPASVWGKAVTAVERGHEMMDVRKMPISSAPLTRYIIRNTVRMLRARHRGRNSRQQHAVGAWDAASTYPPTKIPSHIVGRRMTLVPQ